MQLIKIDCSAKSQTYSGTGTISEPTVHDLFNELRRRIVTDAYEAPLGSSAELNRIYTDLDALHHDYTELIS